MVSYYKFLQTLEVERIGRLYTVILIRVFFPSSPPFSNVFDTISLCEYARRCMEWIHTSRLQQRLSEEEGLYTARVIALVFLYESRAI